MKNNSGNDPEIAARENDSARQERGYLAAEREQDNADGTMDWFKQSQDQQLMAMDVARAQAHIHLNKGNNCRKCGQPKEPTRPNSKFCRRCDHGGKQPTDAQYRAAAKRMFEREGELEIDTDATVSRGSDPGAYVQAWVWVPREDAADSPLCPCKQSGTDGTLEHHGEITAIKFRAQKTKTCENHRERYLNSGWELDLG